MIATIENGILTVANAGDSRALLISSYCTTQLSTDHSTNNQSEKVRIEA